MSELSELKDEIRKLREEIKTLRLSQPTTVYYPQPVYLPQPYYIPVPQPHYYPSGGGFYPCGYASGGGASLQGPSAMLQNGGAAGGMNAGASTLGAYQ